MFPKAFQYITPGAPPGSAPVMHGLAEEEQECEPSRREKIHQVIARAFELPTYEQNIAEARKIPLVTTTHLGRADKEYSQDVERERQFLRPILRAARKHPK